MTEPVIIFNDVSFAYSGKDMILHDASLMVNRGELFGIIGPNGGGKTTLIKLILGLLKPDKGSITVFNKKPHIVSHLIGYVPQEKDVNKNFPISVKDVVLMGRLAKKRLFSFYTERDLDIVRESLRFVEMDSHIDKQMDELSGGQKQRIYIARALSTKPEILLLDEPSTGIDPKFHDELYGLIDRINKHVTIIVVTHDLECLSNRVTSIAYVNRKVTVKKSDELTRENFFDLYHTL